VIHRDVGRLLVEIVDWVATLAHDLGHEPVRVAHCARRIVDECGNGSKARARSWAGMPGPSSAIVMTA
jgi:hypothetical protein